MRARIQELRNLITKAKQAYYYGGTPIMSDAEYDYLEQELERLSPGDPVLAQVGAPVPPNGMLTRARHRLPMGSLSKVNGPQEFTTWYTKCALGGLVHASLKGDGASAAAYYEKGRLLQVISRGDGVEGEDITANAVKFKGLPVLVADPSGSPFSGAVRFEVILTVEDWARVDPTRAKNPRNAGSGIMGRKTGEQAELLSTYAFDLDESAPRTRDVDTEHAKLERLRELGFQVIEAQLLRDASEGVAYHEDITRKRDSLPFWIDGVVFKLDDLALQASLGATAGRPKGQVAWKFESPGAETTLVAYTVSVGHTGALIPIAQLAPVEIGGTTVSSALLNNWDEIGRLDVAVGDLVWVIKANDIIPKIVGVSSRGPERSPITPPAQCPACGGSVARRRNTRGEEGVVIECTNDDCPAQALGKIKRWTKNLDIQGIGESIRQALVRELGLQDVAGLYRLHETPEALANLTVTQAPKDGPQQGFGFSEERGRAPTTANLAAQTAPGNVKVRLGAKRAQSILDEIERKRVLTLVQFLGSLGIEGVGSRRVELMITQAGGLLDTLGDWLSGKLRTPELAARCGVPELGAAIQDYLDGQREVIEGLLAAGVTVAGIGTQSSTNLSPGASNQTLCISGSLPSGRKKAEYEDLLRVHGIQLVDRVTRDLSYLVLADPSNKTTKAEQARRYGVRLLTPTELDTLVETGGIEPG